MKSFMSNLVFTAALLAAGLGACRSSFATTVHPGDSFDLAYDASPFDPRIAPYTRALWDLFFHAGPFDPCVPSCGDVQVVAFDSGNTPIGSEVVPLHYYRVEGELYWATAIGPTNDPVGHLRFTSLNSTFDVDVSRSSVVIGNDFILLGEPLPAALPLFATGLGMLGLLGWRRKRKTLADAA